MSVVPTLPASLKQTPITTERICDQLYKWCGVTLDSTKTYLIENRLRSVLQELDFQDYESLLAAAQRSDGMRVRDRIVDALTTHETLFFRDQSPFDALSKVILPELEKKAAGATPKLRIWSAACSTGQEPFSLAIRLLDSIPNLSKWNLSILATDVAVATVEQAKAGVYQNHEVRRGITDAQRAKFFRQVGDSWRLTDKVRSLVQFQVGNLNGTAQPVGPFDLIFCRNVLIYFKPDDAQRILRMLASRLTPHGRLFVGCSEVLRNVNDFLTSERCGNATCYRRIN